MSTGDWVLVVVVVVLLVLAFLLLRAISGALGTMRGRAQARERRRGRQTPR